ncbi:flavohemoglobin expression-modulating QEGLA motif protein [Candidatus Saccharibacteria bacterium]|nr:flavohemoglobin expression-modulating QEGLA motif protein [Candidatus Saccharibacteria bacterium]
MNRELGSFSGERDRMESSGAEKVELVERPEVVEAFEEGFDRTDSTIIEKFRPSNAEVAKKEFLSSDELRQPNNEYGALTEEVLEKLEGSLGEVEEALAGINMGEITKKAYEGELRVRRKNLELLKMAKKVQENPGDTMAAERYMDLNRELYGEPEGSVYKSLLVEKIVSIDKGRLGEEGANIYGELMACVSGDMEGAEEDGRFKPEDETVEFIGEMARDFYGNFLEVVPDTSRDGKEFTAEEIKEVFAAVLESLQSGPQFAMGWSVDWSESGGITVSASEKKIYIPKNRAAVSKAKLEGLLVHEIGTHVYRAEIGEMMGVKPLAQGMSGYADTEEGVARVMEMAVMGEYEEAGVPLYITEGLAYFGERDFRDVFEASWRMDLLTDGKYNFSEEAVKKAKDMAYARTQRVFRGTDTLPWFKDLSYYNGGAKIWKYIEDNMGSLTLFDDLFLGGKNNILDTDHQRLVYEIKVGKG